MEEYHEWIGNFCIHIFKVGDISMISCWHISNAGEMELKETFRTYIVVHARGMKVQQICRSHGVLFNRTYD